MPGPERVFSRELFGPWLLRQIDSSTDSSTFEGVYWLDTIKTLFRVPWKHLNTRDRNESDYSIFKAWAVASGKYIATCEDPPTWKRNFRSALKSVTTGDRKMFTEIEDHSHDQHDPHKIYQVYRAQPIPLLPAFICAPSEAPSAQSCINEAELEDFGLRISPNDAPVLQFPLNRSKLPDKYELVQNAESRIHDSGAQVTLMANGHFESSREMLNYAPVTYEGDHLFQPIGSATQPIVYGTQVPEHEIYNMYCAEYPADVPPPDSTHQAEATQVPFVDNNVEALLPSEDACALPTDHRRFPSILEWEVTVIYKGKEVLKQLVTKKCVISTGTVNPSLEPVEHVCLPSTDVLVDQTQIQYTNTILENVQDGLLLDINSQDFKLYASRFGKTRVYWSMSKDLEVPANGAEANAISRDAASIIFDFQKFWRDLKDFKNRQARSPDYTIYMSFGQNLDNPINRKLVLVKLVPQFCVYMCEYLQRQGISSLSQEFISLQISNGNSFNYEEVEDFMDMDIDFSCLV
uniref:Interferon regulatory factor 7 n=1 Tax=Leptobrachium leishanense TaxID=445787 RepID=A0A8C5MYG6_9ANUR